MKKKIMSFSKVVSDLLILAGLISWSSSVLFIGMFGIPHTQKWSVQDNWHELGPDMISKLYGVDANSSDLIEEPDRSLKLLVVVSSVVASMGYDQAIFFEGMLHYWATILIFTSFFMSNSLLTPLF